MVSKGRISVDRSDDTWQDEPGHLCTVYTGYVLIAYHGLAPDLTITREFDTAEERDAWLKAMEDGLDGAEIEQEQHHGK